MTDLRSDSTEKWKFVIFISKFGFHLIVASIGKAFGVLINDMILVFETNVAILGLLCSIPIALMLMICPIIAYLLSAHGGNPRLISLFGMTCSFGALILSSLTRSCVLLGIYLTVLGIGLAMGYMASYVMLNEYFPKSFILLNTVTEIGSSVGVLFIPLLVDQCRRAYGYSGAMLIFSAIFSHLIAGSATLKPPQSEETSKVPKKLDHSMASESQWSDHEGAGTASQSKSNQIERKQVDAIRIGSKGGKIIRGQEEIANSNPSVTERCCSEDGRNTLSTQSEKQRCEDKHTHKKYHKGKDSKHDEVCCHPSSSESSSSDDSGHEDMDEKVPLFIQQIEQSAKDKASEDICQTDERDLRQHTSIKRFFINSIFIQEPLFTLLLPVHFLSHVCLYAWILYLVPHAEWQGIGSPEAALLSSIGGVGALLGRISLAVLLYFGVDLFVICSICAVVALATFFIDPWCTSYGMLCLTAFLQGWTLFINSCSRAAMCKITTSSQTFVRGCGYAALSSGVGGISGCFVAGVLFDETHSFHTVFLFLGATQLLIVLNIVIYLLIIHIKGNGHYHDNVD